jgi:hypothetical protein
MIWINLNSEYLWDNTERVLEEKKDIENLVFMEMKTQKFVFKDMSM